MLDDCADEIAAGIAHLPTELPHGESIDWAPSDELTVHFPLDDDGREALSRQAHAVDSHLTFEPGMVGRAATFDGAGAIDAGAAGDFGYFDKFTFAAWIRPLAASGTILAKMSEATDADGYSVVLDDRQIASQPRQAMARRRAARRNRRIACARSLATRRGHLRRLAHRVRCESVR